MTDETIQYGECEDCGPVDRVDEDGCCLMCGADALRHTTADDLLAEVRALRTRAEAAERERDGLARLARTAAETCVSRGSTADRCGYCATCVLHDALAALEAKEAARG